jgi:AAA15 family ATPase/GTPase
MANFDVEKFDEIYINEYLSENAQYLHDFQIYTLNTLALRGLVSVSHQNPVGIYGENLDVLIANFDEEERTQLKQYFHLIDWLENYILDTEDALKLRGFKQNLSTSRLYFEDKYMMKKGNNHIFSSENANEGILHLFFYLGIMISKNTPSFFAIDNIESCLNPHLCRHLMKEICKLAKENDKQVIITTHNPAILDGLNLHDDEIRLFEVKRNDRGLTKTRRIKTKPSTNGKQYKLSELWTQGYLGAIPENF